jgi:[ribosomal protein S5]-alanine N-acetyltransferase
MTAGRVPTLTGRLCSLRKLVPADADDIARHANDAAVVRNLYDGFPYPYTLEEAQDWCGEGHLEPQFGHVFAIAHEGRAIGCLGVMQQPGHHACNAEVGYWIGRDFWGRGITTEALGLATAWTWQALPAVQRIVAPIFARNAASQRVAVKAGFVLEALQPRSLIKGGAVIDVALFAIYRPAAIPA